MTKRFYSNGKLLLTGEYVVLDGATALAVPTKFGQDLSVESITAQELVWASFTNNNTCWFEARFELDKLRLISATFNSEKEGGSEMIAETLQKILQAAKQLNPHFLKQQNGILVKTKLTFPKNWGLGSSSTLINNIAQWANIDPFTLLWNSFSGSGYDIACASNNSAIYYNLTSKKPSITPLEFKPEFEDALYFIHLNKKQNSRDGIAKYKENKRDLSTEISEISTLSEAFYKAKNIEELNNIIDTHEKIISTIISTPPVKQTLFPDYFGSIKSLGAWGGDFILATGNNDTVSYFKNKGFETILTYKDMVL